MPVTRGVYLYDDEDDVIQRMARRDHRSTSYILGELLRESPRFQRAMYDREQTEKFNKESKESRKK